MCLVFPLGLRRFPLYSGNCPIIWKPVQILQLHIFLFQSKVQHNIVIQKNIFVLITFLLQNKVQHIIVIQNAFLCLPNFFFRTKCNTILLFKKRFCAYHTSAIRCHLDFSRSTLHSAPNDYNTDKLSTSIKGHTIT